MGNSKKILISMILLFSTKILCENKFSLGIFDTGHTEKYRIQPFIDIAESVGFEVKYKPISEIVDDNPKKLNLDQYNGIFFVTNIEFLQGMAKSSIAHKILRIINIFGEKENKLIGLFLPPIGCKNNIINKAAIFNPILSRVGLDTRDYPFKIISKNKNLENINKEQLVDSLKNLTSSVKFILDVPMEARASLYDTTLSSPKNIHCIPPTILNNNFFASLPIKQICDSELKPLLPLGLYFYNPVRKNKVFIASNSLLSFSGIEESFHICPTNLKLRKQLHELIQEMLWELNSIVTNKNNSINYSKIQRKEKSQLPEAIINLDKPLTLTTKIDPKKIAWMDLAFLENEEKEKGQDLLIDSILKSGPDLYLWITLNPQIFYSPIAKHLNKKELWWKTIKRFTKNLKSKSEKLKVDPPKILIGFEITNNIYEPNLPKNPPIDIYGNTYPDIPRPLDEHFWQTEIQDPLKKFIEEWKKPDVNNGIKIAGVILDLEMYCRKTTGSFLPTMGFNSQNLQKFDIKNVFLLAEQQKVCDYFNFLEDQSTLLGKKLRRNIKKQIPNAIIGCYAPNISTNWFYKGLYRGLSSKDNPLNLLTFNTQIKTHQNWLKENKINANHLSVLMLSKVKNENDFGKIEEILKHNHGIWLNKFSRFAEPQHADWMNIEQSSIKNPDEFFNYLKKVH